MAKAREIIDLNYLKEASADNQLFVKEMIEIFLHQTPIYLAELKKNIKENDWEAFKKAIHKLKPTMTMMGIKQGDLLIKEIEAILKNHQGTDQIDALLLQLENLSGNAYDELKEEIRLMD